MPSRVQARPWPESLSCSFSASARAANAAASTRSSGSSKTCVTSRSGGRFAYRQRSFVLTAGQTVSKRRVEAEPGQHVGGGQRSEPAEGPDAEPAQQIDQLVPPDRGDVEVGEEGGRGAGCDDPAAARGKPRGERALGDADLRLDAGDLSNLLDQVLGGGFLTTEVAGRAASVQRTHAGPDDVDAGCHLLDRGHHGFEGAGVAALVALDHDDLRAARLSFPLAQAEPDALGPGRGGARDDPVGGEHHDRLKRRNAVDQTGGHDRPVRAPNDERTRHEQQFRTYVR